jgi:hypothetical protein
MQDEAAQYIPVEEAAAILGLSIRQTSRYAGKVRTKRIGTRVLFHRGDIEQQAEEKRIKDQIHEEAQPYKPPPKQPSTELMPPGDMLDYLRERDQQVERLTQQLTAAAHRVGELEAMLQQRLLPEDAEALRRERDDLRERLRHLEPQQKKSWWQRWFGQDEATRDDVPGRDRQGEATADD